MPDGNRIEGPEPIRQPPPGQIPTIDDFGGGYYIDPKFVEYQLAHGHDPHLEGAPAAAIAETTVYSDEQMP